MDLAQQGANIITQNTAGNPSSPSGSGGGAVYWVGQDGNVWLKDATGTRNMGTAQSTMDNGFESQYGSGVATRIGDPLPGGVRTSSAPSGGSGVAAPPPLNQAAVDATNASISSLDQILAQALASADTGYTNALNVLNTQEQQEKGKYDESTLSNMGNYDSNLAAALRAGRSGLSGLMAALRGGGGAGNKFARDWVQNTVADTTSNDIREGYNTFDENRQELDSSMSTFLTNLKGKRAQNEDTRENNKRAAQLYDAEQRQNLLQKLAGFFSEAGRNDEAGSYIARAGQLAPTIASNMGAKVSAYDTSPVQVESADITAFSQPEEQSMGASPDKQSTGIFSLNDPRRRERREALAGV